jgi:Mor family transcriptional regulator
MIEDPSEDFVAQLVELIARCVGGFEEQLASQIEEQIRDAYGGERVYIHRAGWFNKAQRDQAIREERARGRSLGWLAARFSLPRSTVRRICGELD